MVAPFDHALHHLRDGLHRLEGTRKSLHARWVSGWLASIGIGAGVALAAFLTITSGYPLAGVFVGFAGVSIVVGCYHAWVATPQREYSLLFKRSFIGPLVASAGEQVVFDPHASVGLDEYYYCGLYPRQVDRWKGEDLIAGRIGQTDVRMSELHTEYRSSTTDSKGRRRETWHTIFRGLFISADFHKHFHGATFVQTDFAERNFGSLGTWFQGTTSPGLEVVRLEDPEFEKSFIVKSTDQVEARYILSTAMMRRMLELRARFQTEPEFAFVASRMFVALPTNVDLFEASLGQSVLDAGYLRKYYDQVAACAGLVEDLGLNVRVWSKT